MTSVTVDAFGEVSCPAAAAIERALARRRFAPQHPGWRVAVRAIRSTTNGTLLRVLVHEPSGVAVFERELEVTPAACDSAAEAIALMVERYFRDVAWSTGPAIEPAAKLDSDTRPTPQHARLLALLGPTFWTRQSWVGASAEVRAGAGGPIQGGVGFLVPPGSQTEALRGGGQARLSAWPVTLRALVEKRRDTLALTAGLDLLVTAERGESAQIPMPAVQRRLLLGAGVSLGMAWLATPKLGVVLEVSGMRLCAGRDFQIAGLGRGSILTPPLWQAMTSIRLGWALWP
jgi:hypothetical protein